MGEEGLHFIKTTETGSIFKEQFAEHVGFTFIFSDNAEEEVPGDEESKRAEMVRGSQGRKRSAPSDIEDQVNLLRKVNFVKMHQHKIQSDNN